MKFTGMMVLTKVGDKVITTETSADILKFDTTVITLEDKELLAKVGKDVVVFVANSHKERLYTEKNAGKKPEYNLEVAWLKVLTSNAVIPLEENATDILIITKEMYANLSDRFQTDLEIYKHFKLEGLYQASINLEGKQTFCMLTANIR